MATGMGVDLCLPVMRRAVEKKGGKLSYEEAKETMQQCIRLCYLRDCRSWPNYHLARVDGNMTNVSLTSLMTVTRRRMHCRGTTLHRLRLELRQGSEGIRVEDKNI